MFMFRKKDTRVSTTIGQQGEAIKFQKAVSEINTNYKMGEIDYALLESVAIKYGVDITYLEQSFETYLKGNAIAEIKTIKATQGADVMQLGQAAEKYGFELDDLGITILSDD